MTKSLLRQHYRFVVTMEDEEGCVKTFSVTATASSIATARTSMYIEENKLHTIDGPYYLIPRLSKEKAEYEIN